MTGSRGYIFATSGPGYTEIAHDAARSLRAVSPSAQIDIFTDCPVEPGVFDQVHDLQKSWFRPKFEALARTRFDRTIYLDADIRVVGDISDVFDVLDRFDVMACHDQYRNPSGGHAIEPDPLINAFPHVNSGVLACHGTRQIRDFFTDVAETLAATGAGLDQPILRRKLYDSDLRLGILPPEYNMMACRQFEAWEHNQAAPRVIHSPEFHRHLSRGHAQKTSLDHAIGPVARAHLDRLIAADKALSPGTTATPGRLIDRGFTGRVRYGYAWIMRQMAWRLRWGNRR
ncbi:glycosyltransferase [Shimia biformata]|uniref:glycosyltransferase n=1 Tax=Shimia biformata TaxID=1294299 RepID=UPI00194F394F|nr:glycosyltransferase [Shimia biformata]